jgi:hypothetical protein
VDAATSNDGGIYEVDTKIPTLVLLPFFPVPPPLVPSANTMAEQYGKFQIHYNPLKIYASSIYA